MNIRYQKAVYSFQQVLLLVPNAYNIFARLGELYHALYLQTSESPSNSSSLSRDNTLIEYLKQGLKNFLRSVELCPVYVRGWAGVQVITKEALKINEKYVENTSNSNLSLNFSEKEKKQYTKLAELSERQLVYFTTESDSNKDQNVLSNEETEAAKAILQNY